MVSKRIRAMKPSATSALAGRVLALKASGAEIAAFNVGEPDFPTPAPIVEAYAMTGWRIGYAAGPEDVVRGMVSLQGHCTSNITTFVQWAALTALQECDDSVEAMRQEFERRREYMYERLARIPGLPCPKPEGAFYLMPDVSSYYGKSFGNWRAENAEDLCDYLLREARIAIVPGGAFEAPNCVRISYSASMETIRAGMDQMEQALEQLA